MPKAFVVLKGEATAEELMAFVAARVAPYKKVRRLEFVEPDPEVALRQDPAPRAGRARARDCARSDRRLRGDIEPTITCAQHRAAVSGCADSRSGSSGQSDSGAVVLHEPRRAAGDLLAVQATHDVEGHVDPGGNTG